MVKWYFIAAGIAKHCVLRETKAYPERLWSALEYISKRMGAASVRPPLVEYERQTEPETTSEVANPTIDESHIQFALAEITSNLISPPITSRTAPPCPSTAHEEQSSNSFNAADALKSRVTKRTAENAELAESVSQVLIADGDLTDQFAISTGRLSCCRCNVETW
jgi:hypothetical protein